MSIYRVCDYPADREAWREYVAGVDRALAVPGVSGRSREALFRTRRAAVRLSGDRALSGVPATPSASRADEEAASN